MRGFAQLLDGLLNEVLSTGVVEWQMSRATDGAFDAPFAAKGAPVPDAGVPSRFTPRSVSVWTAGVLTAW